ncbi:uncharacterized protein TNCV_3901311 [Trichonephila clavipes]|nr:uncharacterized protein TNCV_3901311 [Trichonephila clavipes]
MTINKPQGQTMTIGGLDLENLCFSHDQLYVACPSSPAAVLHSLKVHGIDLDQQRADFSLVRANSSFFKVFRSTQWRVAAVVEWYRYRTVACFVTGLSPVPLKTRRVGQRCTLNLSRAETSSRWCGVVVRRGGASSGVVHVT